MNKFYALIIGVGDDLPETVKDAVAIRDVLTANLNTGYTMQTVHCLLDKQSSKSSVLATMDLLAQQLLENPDATVVIYYSGHGNRYLDGNGHKYYLKTYGGSSTDLEGTMLSGELFTEKVNQLKAKRIFVMLDCCHAAGMASFSHTPLHELLKGGASKVILSSCGDDETSVILPEAENSLFTAVAIEVMTGLTLPSKEYIGAIDLIYHVLTEVPKRLESWDHEQNPILSEAHQVSGKYFVCKNASYTGLVIKSQAVRDEIIDPLLDMAGIDIARRRDLFEQHAVEAFEIRRDDINYLDDFLDFQQIKAGDVPEQVKINVLKDVGGVQNFERMKKHFKFGKIRMLREADAVTEEVFWNGIGQKADEIQKKDFIMNYKYKI